MPRSGWLLLVCACVAGTALGAVPRPPADVVVRGTLDLVPTEDPFPIRRVRGDDARLPELLKELETGSVVRMPRADFESKVRAAGRATHQTKHGARIADATYMAELDGGDLTGTAELGVLNASGATGFLSLDPLKLAVSSAKWAEGGEAVWAVLPTSVQNVHAPAVWVGHDGRRVLQFTWSLTGTTEPGERRFELRVPPCPTAALELNLPAEQVPTASADVLLTGPFEILGKPARRAWKLRFGGRAKLEFAVRAGGMPSVGATASLVAKYELSPGQLAVAFEYELHPTRGSVSEWTFTADTGLRITEVIANNRAGWVVDPPLVPNGPRSVRVNLRQPGPGGKILINAVAPLPDPARLADAPLPAVRPVGAVIESEAVELRIAAGLKIDSWVPGDYRLTDALSPPPNAIDQTRVLSLVGTLLPTGVDEPFRRMPAVRTVTPDVEFTTVERLEWTPGATRSALVARVRVRVVLGPVFQFLLRPLPGFVLDRGAAGTDELVAYIGPPVPTGQVIELARPLLTGQQAELRFEFRGTGVKAGDPVPFPAFALLGATERDGWLSVAADPAWAVSVRPGAGATPTGLWGWLLTDAPRDSRAVYSFRAKEPDGFATITLACPKVNAQAVVILDAPDERLTATTRFTITATGGALSTLVVVVPGPPDARSWQLLDPANAVIDAVPVPPELLNLMPLFSPFDIGANAVGARLWVGAAGGTVWVLRFARPLTGVAVLETTAPGRPLADKVFAPLPVPVLPGADQTTRAEVAPALTGRMLVSLESGSLQIFRLAPAACEIVRGTVSDAYLLTAVRAPEEVVAAFGATVDAPTGGVLPVSLPPGAEVRGVCVAGQWLNPAVCRSGDGAIRVPIPTGPAVRFEVRYRLPAATGWPTRRVTSPAPTVPGDPPVRRWWSFATGTLPGWPARPWDATTDEPPLLGGPLVSGPPAFVTKTDDESVRVGAVRGADTLAVVLVVLVVALGCVALRRGRGVLVLTGAVGAAVVVAELGPPWWARAAWSVLCAACVALTGVLASIALRRRAVRPVVAPVLFLGFALVSLNALAQPAAPATVLIVPCADGSEEIIAPRALLERLDAIAHPGRPAPVVSSAVYDVRSNESRARVTAKFVVYAFRPSDNVVSLALSDARLESVTMNGVAAFPTVPRPDTYAVELAGPGRHEIEVRFSATVTTSGAEREVKFGVPEVADAKLLASLPGAARQPQAIGRVGRQAVETGGDRTTIGADLGAVKQVQLRWREGASGAAVIKVREGCIWDVTETGAELTAAYLIRVEQGTVAGLRFDVPAELEVLRVAVRSTELPAAPIAMRDWALALPKDGVRSLRLDFQAPAAGRFLVVLECAPRKSLTRQPVLRFPRVAFGTLKGDTEAIYGLRVTRVTLDEVGRGGVIDFPADPLRLDFAGVPDLKLDPNTPIKAFRLVPGATAELRPVLRAGDVPVVRTLTSWRVGPSRADATGTVSWAARDPVAFVEFSISNVKVLEVRGLDVLGWTQSGTRVQVWLRAGTREDTIEWTGAAVPSSASKPAPGPLTFDSAHPKVAHSRLALDEVRVRALDGWAVKVDRARGWQTVPSPAGELRFRTDSPTSQGLRVQLTPAR